MSSLAVSITIATPGLASASSPGRRQPAAARHRDVHQHEVRPQRAGRAPRPRRRRPPAPRPRGPRRRAATRRRRGTARGRRRAGCASSAPRTGGRRRGPPAGSRRVDAGARRAARGRRGQVTRTTPAADLVARGSSPRSPPRARASTGGRSGRRHRRRRPGAEAPTVVVDRGASSTLAATTIATRTPRRAGRACGRWSGPPARSGRGAPPPPGPGAGRGRGGDRQSSSTKRRASAARGGHARRSRRRGPAPARSGRAGRGSTRGRRRTRHARPHPSSATWTRASSMRPAARYPSTAWRLRVHVAQHLGDPVVELAGDALPLLDDRELAQPGLEPRVLQGDRRLVGERGERLHLVGVEAARRSRAPTASRPMVSPPRCSGADSRTTARPGRRTGASRRPGAGAPGRRRLAREARRARPSSPDRRVQVGPAPGGARGSSRPSLPSSSSTATSAAEQLAGVGHDRLEHEVDVGQRGDRQLTRCRARADAPRASSSAFRARSAPSAHRSAGRRPRRATSPSTSDRPAATATA